MNQLGITEWRTVDSLYPFNGSDYAGLFYDAQFVLFDYETPLLSSITINTQLVFNFLFDGVNTVAFPFDITGCVENATVQLRYNTRYYGSVTFGPYITTVLANLAGQTTKIDESFHQDTVRVINSQAGVYSVQGMSGALNITFSSNDFLLNTINPASLSAITAPNLTNPVVPLRTINGIQASNFQITGDEIITVTANGQDSITVAMLIDESLTNITKTTQFGI